MSSDSEQRLCGVVLINSGTPASPNPEDVKPYLAEFLSDTHLISVPPLIWQRILHTFILPKRQYASAERYQQIWTEEGSPLLVTSRQQSHAVQTALDRKHPESFLVKAGMRYGEPSLRTVLKQLEQAGCKHIVAIPLFPQTAHSTTKTCIDKLEELRASFPNLTFSYVEGYSTQELYLQAMTEQIASHWEHQPGSKLVYTFHSVPCKHLQQGDTYVDEITTSMTEVSKRLNLNDEDWCIAYQSRFEDSRKWVGPGIMTTLRTLVNEGVSRIAVVTPGFAAECLETLYDCEIEQRKFFETLCHQKGLTPAFTYIPALSSHPLFIDMLADLVEQNSEIPNA